MVTISRTPASTRPLWVLKTPNDARRALAQPSVMLTGMTILSFGDGPCVEQFEGRVRRLRFWQSVCGCQLAALTFLGYILVGAAKAWPFAHVNGWALVSTFCVALGAAIAAKFAAILAARLVLAIELFRLSSAEKMAFPGEVEELQ
jgi:hypothetical protein